MDSSNSKKQHLMMILVFFAVTIIQVIYYLNCRIGQLHSDSNSYMYYSAETGARTPGYPFVIDVSRIVFRSNPESGVAIIQIIVSLISVVFFYLALKSITGRNGLSLFGTLIYGCSSAVFCWNTMVITDSLGISLTVFFIYFAVRWLKTYSFIDGAFLALVCLICPFIKTALFVYAFAVVLLLIPLLIFEKSHRKEIAVELILFLMIMFIFLMYCYRNLYLVGVFNFSALGPRHQLVKCLQTGIYKYYPDQELVQKITEIYTRRNFDIEYETTSEIMKLFGDTYRLQMMNTGKFCKYCNQVGRKELLQWNLGLVAKIISWTFTNKNTEVIFRNSFFQSVLTVTNTVFNWMKVGYVYILCAASWLITIIKSLFQKKMDWIWLGIAGGMLTILLSVFVGTYGEWLRTLSYILPFAYISFMMLINEILGLLKR